MGFNKLTLESIGIQTYILKKPIEYLRQKW